MPKSSPLYYERMIRAAEGYAELGLMLDADVESEEIEPDLREDSRVLALRL